MPDPIVPFMPPELPKNVHVIMVQTKRQIVQLLTGDRYEGIWHVCDKWPLTGG